MQIDPHLEQEYRNLQDSVDQWFSNCLEAGGEMLACRAGCGSCCRGLFDITLLDAFLLKRAFAELPETIRETILGKCRLRLNQLLQRWPGLGPPFLLNRLPEQEWTEMPEDDETPCPLLGEQGVCLIYSDRPLICRLHGLPNIDCSGEDFEGTVCSLHRNDPETLPTEILRAEFRDIFAKEVEILRQFAKGLTGQATAELDTFIPLALLADYDAVDWRNGAWSQ